jgi:hypothetical protein
VGFIVVLLASDLGLGALSVAAGWSPAVGPSSLGLIAGWVLSPIFLVAASLEILAIGFLSWGKLDRRLEVLVLAQAALVFLTPTTIPQAGWSVIAAYAGIGLFVALFILLLQYVYRTKQLSATVSRLLVRWTAAATLTSVGWFLWHFYGTPVVLVPSIFVQMVVFLDAALAPAPPSSEPRVPWLAHPFWVFLVLLGTFSTEFFLGALLDYEVAGPMFLQYIPALPYSSGLAGTVGIAIYNGLWFVAAILASSWFLIVIGVTMSALVVFKIRETRERPQRYRLGLMIGVYALAVVYVPSFASSTPITTLPALANLPVVGWGFGLRDGGPFESGVFLAILIMYALVGVLTVLFGRKALCAVMCGAALLYQGTAISEMRGFNQTSRVGRYFLGSQLSNAYIVLSSVALVSLFATSLLGVLNLLPAVQLPNGELDTAALPLPIELYFGGLWFAMFVTVPYLGTYNCATTGFCHWGALSIPFAKVGFFRLKVKDKKVCQACTTFDCAKACPVGLVDMPLHFRTKGEYRSTKCCGVGDCVGACPYGNMYHQDVRLWLRRRLSRTVPGPHGTPLPMLQSSSRPTSSPPEAASPVSEGSQVG